jgi:transcriptional regulator with XRE-family HTH domain
LDNQPNSNNNRFGYWVQSLRKAKGKTQREVAVAAGIDFTYLSKLEHGKDPAPSEDLIKRLALVLEVPAEYLQAAAGKVPSQVRQRVDQSPRFALLLKRLAESDDAILDRHYRLAGIKEVTSPVEAKVPPRKAYRKSP